MRTSSPSFGFLGLVARRPPWLGVWPRVAVLSAALGLLSPGCSGETGPPRAEPADAAGDAALPDVSPPACQGSTETLELARGAIPTGPGTTSSFPPALLGLVRFDGDVWALVGSPQGDLSVHLQFVRPGATTRDVAVLSDVYQYGGGHYAYYAAPVVLDGRLCAVTSWEGATLACEGGVLEDAGLGELEAHGRMVPPIVRPDGSMAVFAQTHSSYTVFERSAAGVWSEVEKYESSVSYPRDAVAAPGGPVSCFVDSDGRVKVDAEEAGGAMWASGVESDTCRVATDGVGLFALAGETFFELPGTDGQAVDGLAANDGDLGPLFVRGGATFVVAAREGQAEVVPVSGGAVSAPLSLGMDASDEYLVTEDAVWGVGWEDGATPGVITLRFSRACLPPSP